MTPQTVARQAPLSMGFSRQEYWLGLLFPLPRDLPDPGIELVSLWPLTLAGGFFATEPPVKPHSKLTGVSSQASAILKVNVLFCIHTVA